MIAWVDDGVLVIDGRTYAALPRGRQWAGRTVYLVDGSIHDIATRYACRGDTASGPRPPTVQALDVVCGGGTWALRRGDVWGLPAEARAAQVRLDDMRRAVTAEGWTWRATASGLARRVGQAVVPAVGGRRTGLPETYRGIWSHAVCPGPMWVARGSSERAVQLDLREAYLRGLECTTVWRHYAPVPPGTAWGDVRGYDGVVTAVIGVPLDWHAGPLPATHLGATIWPVGTVGGTWTIAALRGAEALGIEVLLVADGLVGTVGATSLAPLARRVRSVAYAPLRRALYTRWWSRWCSEGWWRTVAPSERPRWRELEWTCRPPWRSERRPDVSASVAAYGWLPLVGMIRTHGRHVVAAHVDAIFTELDGSDDDVCQRKSTGPGRWYSIGVWDHGGRLATAGCPPHIRTREERLRWASSGGTSAATTVGRQWYTAGPGTDAAAASGPVVAACDDRWVMPHVPTWGGHRPLMRDIM